MLTGSSASPFAAIESAVYKTLFTGYSPYAALTGEVNEERVDNGAGNTTKESSKNGAAGKRTAVSSAKLQSGAPEAKEESENAETSSCKKSD